MRWSLLLAVGTIGITGRAEGQAHLDPAGYVRRTWVDVGRSYVGGMSGARFDRGWVTDTTWERASEAGAAMYDVEPVVRSALNVALATRDTAWLGELAEYFLAVRPRFRPAAELARSPGARLRGAGREDRLLLPWRDRGLPGAPQAECLLCTGQFLHPAARLVRGLAALPPNGRPANADRFVRSYLPLLVRDHLLAGGYASTTQVERLDGLPAALVPFWEATTAPAAREGREVATAFRDRDLWLLAAAAEVLLAATLDPALVAIPEGQRDSLRRLVQVGSARWAASVTPHRETRDWGGRRVGSLGVFEGDFAGHPDLRYAGVRSEANPSGAPPAPMQRVSWDVSHARRIPIALRSLWDARPASGATWPDSSAMVGIVKGYLYRAFTGDLRRPRFKNFLDGTDGWYRAGYAGREGFGYPPSAACDAGSRDRPCLGAFGILGWGELARSHPDLIRVGRALRTLAMDRSSDGRRFRTRYYQAFGRDLGAMTADGRPQASLLLAILLGDQIYGETFHFGVTGT
jgi:hypothetical protein